MDDSVDTFIAAWEHERPDLDFWPVGIIGRIQRINRLLDKQLAGVFTPYGLDVGEVDLLFTLRRAGHPYQLTAGTLLATAMVTSGAITNRVDRLEAKGLVERVRSSTDRRSVNIRLTTTGHTLSDQLIDAHLVNENRILENLPGTDARNTTDRLRALVNLLDDPSTHEPTSDNRPCDDT